MGELPNHINGQPYFICVNPVVGQVSIECLKLSGTILRVFAVVCERLPPALAKLALFLCSLERLAIEFVI